MRTSLLLTVLAALLMASPALAAPPTPQQLLSLAMVQKKLDQVQTILAQNPGLVNTQFDSGATPLLAAIGLQADANLLNAGPTRTCPAAPARLPSCPPSAPGSPPR